MYSKGNFACTVPLLLSLFCACCCVTLRTVDGKIRQNETVDNQFTVQTSINYAAKGSKICMGELGCFVLTNDFYHLLYRPFNMLPNDRATINTRFHLFTRENPKEFWDLSVDNPEGIKQSPIDKKNPTKFIIHGFLDRRWYAKWIEALKDDLLLQRDYNVFIVDWSGGNSFPYSKASANTRVVGAEIALMINTLQKLKGISPMDCHIIGHSLGAHAAGYAGERLNKLGRISAADPAEPYFQNMPPSVRLDPTDANFVDVIHTDSVSMLLMGLGMSQLVGHVDFFPNNGKNQPGCKTEAFKSLFLEGLLDATRRFAACNHQRAVDFYIHSINYKKILPIGYECASWEEFTKGHCTDCGMDGKKCAIMGQRADEYIPHRNNSRSVKLYLATRRSSPFWVLQYEVTVKLAKPKLTVSDQEGKMTLLLKGGQESLETEWKPVSNKFQHGETYTFMVKSEKELGPIKSITVTWKSSSWNILKAKIIYIEYIKVEPMNAASTKERSKYAKIFCDKPNRPFSAQTTVILSEECQKKI